MGLAKKGTSRIVVDSAAYRWVVSGNDGFLDVLVERFEGKGQRLAVQVDYDVGEITPKLVRQLILRALAKGWKPAERGTQWDVRLVGEDLVPMKEIRLQWSEGGADEASL